MSQLPSKSQGHKTTVASWTYSSLIHELGASAQKTAESFRLSKQAHI